MPFVCQVLVLWALHVEFYSNATWGSLQLGSFSAYVLRAQSFYWIPFMSIVLVFLGFRLQLELHNGVSTFISLKSSTSFHLLVYLQFFPSSSLLPIWPSTTIIWVLFSCAKCAHVKLSHAHACLLVELPRGRYAHLDSPIPLVIFKPRAQCVDYSLGNTPQVVFNHKIFVFLLFSLLAWYFVNCLLCIISIFLLSHTVVPPRSMPTLRHPNL